MAIEENENSTPKIQIKRPLDIPSFFSQEHQEQDWEDDEDNPSISQEDG